MNKDIFYYHTNHLGSTAFVTDQNQTITQGFVYAPFGEIITEYNVNFGNNTIPKYSFNAKELDEETGMYYFEARYYRAPTFTSRDPLFEKYFWMSPYAYCANNPVKYVDPDGEFPISAHKKLTKKALENTNLSKNAQKLIIRGASSYADIKLASNNSVHLDNMSNYESIVEGYNAAIEKIGSGDYLEVGVGLHTIADFYSHSNYIDLYSKYADKNGLSMDIDDIPTFSEAMKDPKLSNFLKENGLRTGTYGGSKLGAIGNYLKDMFSTDPNSHGQMNLDFNLGKGKLPFNDSTTLNKAALHVAQKDIHKRVERIE